MSVVVRAVLIGMGVMLAGTLPRNFLFWANLHFVPSVPWAVPLIGGYLWLFWRYLGGAGEPAANAEWRRQSLRANRLPGNQWAWSLVAGTLGLVALVLALRIANRMVVLPQQTTPDLSQIPHATLAVLLVASAGIAGLVEESSFRGYMQRDIERRHGPAIAILITGTMFAVAHLDFTPVLWPYYVAVAAIYGMVAYLTDSILPAIVLHTAGNLHSNFDLWLHGQAEWQAPAATAGLIWDSGADRSFWISLCALLIAAAAAIYAYVRLATATRNVGGVNRMGMVTEEPAQ
jgi:membrane protease YdiL (CAAX protease family)